MAVTYFGNNSSGDGQIELDFGWVRWQNPAQISNLNGDYECPGSGTMEVKELACRTHNNQDNVRVGIYNTDGELIAQGSEEIAEVTDGWVTHTSFVDGDGNPITPELTGGTTYIIAVTSDGAYVHYTGTTSGYIHTLNTDYTGDMPDDFGPLGEQNSGAECCVRCGVESPSAGSSVPAILNQMRRRRG